MSSRWVMVDDADSAVQWGPGWTARQGVQDNPGNWGPPFDGTEHTTDRNSTVSLKFTGTSIIVLGKLDGNNDTVTPDPYWDCLLDGQSIPRSDYPTSYTGHWIFCNQANLPDGEHNFTLNAITKGTRTFSVDQFQYVASPTANIENAKIQIDTSLVSYSSGWVSDDRYSRTYQTGASAVLDFVGVSVQWYGFVPSLASANGPSTAGYKIDGGEQVNFTLAGIPAGSSPGGFSNVLLFETPKLSPGRHKLEVVHYGSTASTPLTVDYIFIQNATIPAGSLTSSTSSSSSTASGSSSTSTTTGTGIPATGGQAEKSTPVGAIVGGVIGGIALLVLIGIFLLLLLRRRRGQGGSKSLDRHSPPDMSDITRPTPLPNPYMQDGRDPSVAYSPYSPNGQVSPSSWQSSQQALAQNQPQAYLLNQSRSKGQLQPGRLSPYTPTQSSLLTSPTSTSNIATSPESASSGSTPDSSEVPPPQYSDIAPPRSPGVIPASKRTILTP